VRKEPSHKPPDTTLAVRCFKLQDRPTNRGAVRTTRTRPIHNDVEMSQSPIPLRGSQILALKNTPFTHQGGGGGGGGECPASVSRKETGKLASRRDDDEALAVVFHLGHKHVDGLLPERVLTALMLERIRLVDE